jgi:predicted SprT family Zn-dependent metalloprotease
MNPEGLEASRNSITRWSRLWGLPRLSREISLRTSSRFRRSLGNYCARRAEIALAVWLVDGPTDLLEEVLCHEAAHAAVHLVHGVGVRPHGPEWRDFMALAEMPARVRIPASELPASRQSALRKARVWEHRCPVCQATRFAKTRVTRWRCRPCREAGHSGELLIERVPSPVAVDG